MLVSKLKISHESPRSRLRGLQHNLSLHPQRIKFLTFKATERGNTGSFKFRRKNVGWSKRSIGNAHEYNTCSGFGQHPCAAQCRCPQKGRTPGGLGCWGLVSPGRGGRSPQAAPRRGPAKSSAHYLPWERKPDCLRLFCYSFFQALLLVFFEGK